MRGSSRPAESGQSTPLVMSMIFVLSLFAAVVVNVGQAVNRRIALQVVADAGAFTGASVMATGLNQMAYWNAWMQRLWAGFSIPMWPALTLHATECDLADAAEGIYVPTRAALGIAYNAVSLVYTHHAYTEAQRVTRYNAVDLFPGEVIEGSESSLLSAEGGNIRFARAWPFLADSRQVADGTLPPAARWASHGSQRSVSYGCLSPPPAFRLEFRQRRYDVWYEKAPSSRPDYFVWIVRAPATKALMFDDLFGGTIIPEMWAAGAARPVGGSIAQGDTRYVVKMVPLSEVLPANEIVPGLPFGVIYDPVVRKPRVVMH